MRRNILFRDRGFMVALLLGLSAANGMAQTNPPSLRLVSSDQTVKVFWTTNAHYYVLQSATNFTLVNSWTNEVSSDLLAVVNTFPANGGYATLITNLVGSNSVFMTAATNPQKFFRLRSLPSIPLCWFNVFYNGALEFTTCPYMVQNGRVHANGPIYVGTVASLTFNTSVTTTNTISAPLLNGTTTNWIPGDSSTWNAFFNGTPASITNCPTLILPIGTNNPYALIDIPPVGENPMTSSLGQQRLYNQAQIVLMVTNSSGSGADTNHTVILTMQAGVNGAVPGDDPSKDVWILTNATTARLATNLPFLNLTNLFFDRRETKTNLVTQIDVGLFAIWSATNSHVQGKLPASSGIYPTILYVADRRNHSATQMPVVRLANATQLPFNNGEGFTVTTLNPLYTWGNYNIQLTNGGNQSVSTNNTDYTVPAALISDSLTILASTWTDAGSYNAFYQGSSSYQTTDTTINAAILTGTVASTGTSSTTFSGGVHNLPRLIQNWINVNLWLNTSIIRLWDSRMATNRFLDPGTYYYPPTRHFNFDTNFLNFTKMPPGIPSVAFSWPTNQ